MRKGALGAGLSVKSGQADAGELITGWSRELKKKWPCSVLFAD
ncbi:MAG: hypothetical protein V2A71_08765 [Candidatus Eisenbacteria bacterium]